MKIDELDKEIFTTIVDILWKYGCTFDDKDVDWVNRIIDKIDCPEEVETKVAIEIEEEISKIERKYINNLVEEE